jgi:hypothetical protein
VADRRGFVTDSLIEGPGDSTRARRCAPRTGCYGEGRRVPSGLIGVSTDDSVHAGGELPRQCPCCRRAPFDPLPALRARRRLFGEDRHVPVGPIGVSNRRLCSFSDFRTKG